jgi:ACR3 family arsenite transporter
VAAPSVYFAVIFACHKLGFGYRSSSTGLRLQVFVHKELHSREQQFRTPIAVIVAVNRAGSVEALASTVGPLIEAPVLIGLVYVMN